MEPKQSAFSEIEPSAEAAGPNPGRRNIRQSLAVAGTDIGLVACMLILIDLMMNWWKYRIGVANYNVIEHRSGMYGWGYVTLVALPFFAMSLIVLTANASIGLARRTIRRITVGVAALLPLSMYMHMRLDSPSGLAIHRTSWQDVGLALSVIAFAAAAGVVISLPASAATARQWNRPAAGSGGKPPGA